MSGEIIKYIIAKVIDYANEAREEANQNVDDDFYKGRKFAYYEILDSIKNEIEVRGYDVKEFGLGANLEKEYL